MKARKDTMHQWLTLWSICGPALPEEPIWISKKVHIRPRNAEEAAEDRPHGPPNPTLTISHGLYVINYPPRDEVQGSHRVQIEVIAADEEDAIKEAEKICDRLTASLSLAVSGVPYYSQLLLYKRADQVDEYSAWSQAATFVTLSDPVPLDNFHLKLGLKLSLLMENDETVNNSFIHLLTAWQLQSTSGSKPLQRSILQHYVLSIEAVVNGAMSQIRKDRKDAIKLEEQKFSKDFSDSLHKRADKAKAIREASTTLREISLTNMIPSIDMLRPILGLPEDICSDAKDLYRFRSRNLSHPGKKQDEGIARWLSSGSRKDEHCLADIVARAFLLAYCQHISK